MKEKSQFKILIDTTDRSEQKVTLLKDGGVIESVKGKLDTTVVMDFILRRHGLEIEDISEFDANPGPGSFTGIKKGITVANVLNWALGIKKRVRPNYGSEPNIHPGNA